jgi:beta-N-acetylhexosaminidase
MPLNKGVSSSGGIGDPRARARLATLTVVVSLGMALTLSVTSDGSGLGGVAAFSNSHLAGERVITGFRGHHPPRAVVRAIRDGRIAGVVLFSGNFDGNAQARRLISRLQAIHRPRGLRDPLLVLVDQEGGLVKRVAGPPRYSAEEMGSMGAGVARSQGRATAKNLRQIGFNVNLAPVLDVARSDSEIGAEHRAFGSRPGKVARVAGAFASGLAGRGVVPTAKHFPGFGAAKVNTDLQTAEINLSKRKLRRIDEAPYRRFAPGGHRMVMLSVATYPSFSPKPAALSRSLASGELRGHEGFEGVSISDSLDSVAARAVGSTHRIALTGARAGTDLLLFTNYHHAIDAEKTLTAALRSDSIRHDDFVDSVARVAALRARLP